MKYYFLVGQQAVGYYPDIERISPFDGDVICFDTETMTPPMLMQMADGWIDFVEIDGEEYETIFKKLYPDIK
jgi:hypothetical protein